MDPQIDTAQGSKGTNPGNGNIDDFLDDVEDLTKAIKDIQTPEVARVRAKVKIALAAAKSALSDGAAQVRGQAKQVSRNTDAYVRENPWQVVGIAAAVGIVLGMMMTRRSD
ncbi:MAG: YqjD family protein [Steroidobacteraceae bacterium]